MFFTPIVEFDVPLRARDMTVRAHNQYVKLALRDTLEEFRLRWWRKRFQMNARHRYGYQRRSRKYEERKRKKKGHSIDMLWSGDTRNKTSNVPPKIRIGGSAEGGKKGISAVAAYRLPFKGGSGRGFDARSNRVVQQILKELSRWAGDEITWAKAFFVDRYMYYVNNHRSGRKRIRTIKR